MGYRTHKILYETYVLPIANYCTGVWGYKSFVAPQVLQNCVNRYYLGVHHYSANASTSMEMDIMSIQYSRWLELLRYFNRLMAMEDDRLPKMVLQWDIVNGSKGWINDVADIASELHLPPPNVSLAYDLDTARANLHSKARQDWWE